MSWGDLYLWEKSQQGYSRPGCLWPLADLRFPTSYAVLAPSVCPSQLNSVLHSHKKLGITGAPPPDGTLTRRPYANVTSYTSRGALLGLSTPPTQDPEEDTPALSSQGWLALTYVGGGDGKTPQCFPPSIPKAG